MRGRFALLAAALAAGATLYGAMPQSSAPQDPQRFRAAADVVSVEVSVRRDKRSVTGLTAADFDVLDNGVPQQIDTISYERLPIDVSVALDVSASVTGPVLDQLRRSVRQLQPDLTSRDRLKLVAFNMRVQRLVDFRAAGSVGDAALASLPAAGSSAIFDTLAVALAGSSSAGRRHLIIVFTDGKDSASVTDPEGLLDIARHSTPTVAAVLASSTPEQPASTFAPLPFVAVRDFYDRLARETGGAVVYAKADDDLSSTFRRVLAEFRSSYVLYFSPRGVEPSGFHTLDVRVKQPGVDVRARRGYAWR
jgi:VWFA-related protein